MSPLSPLMITLAAVACASGFLLFLYGVFFDRSRGRARCPKCWYELTGLQSLKCPECGHESTTPRQLRRTRRRYGAISLGALMWLLVPAWITWATLDWNRATASAPSWALRSIYPLLASADESDKKDASWQIMNVLYRRSRIVTPDQKQIVFNDSARRLKHGRSMQSRRLACYELTWNHHKIQDVNTAVDPLLTEIQRPDHSIWARHALATVAAKATPQNRERISHIMVDFIHDPNDELRSIAWSCIVYDHSFDVTPIARAVVELTGNPNDAYIAYFLMQRNIDAFDEQEVAGRALTIPLDDFKHYPTASSAYDTLLKFGPKTSAGRAALERLKPFVDQPE